MTWCTVCNSTSSLAVENNFVTAGCTPCEPPPVEYESDYEILCDETAPNVFTPYFVLFQQDETVSGSVTPITIDTAGNPYTPTNPVPCPGQLDKAHVTESCWEDATDCTIRYTNLLCINIETQSITSSLWLRDGAIVAAPGAVQPCGQKLGPYMASASGVASPTFEPFNSFAIYKPACCNITVTTNAGTITLPNKQTTYMSDKFECLLTSLTIAGDCVADTEIYVNRTT